MHSILFKTARAAVLALSVVGLLAASRLARADGPLPIVSYPDFGNPAGLTLVGSAAVPSDAPVVRLTPAQGGLAGAAWLSTPEAVALGFQTTFQFRIHDVSGGGADGLAFVLQNAGLGALGKSGSAIGYVPIRNSLAVELDDFESGGAWNEVAAYVQDSVPTPPVLLGTTGGSLPINFKDGAVHTVTIDYDSATLRAFLDNSATPVLSVPVSLDNALSLGGGPAYVGFASATENTYEAHDILNWSFTPLGPAWDLAGGGSWNNPTNWVTGVAPQNINDIATLGGRITAPSTVTVDVPVTLGTLEFFGSPNAYTIAGPQALTMQTSSGSADILVSGGSHVISTALVLASDTKVTATNSADSLTISGPVSGSGSLTKLGNGTLTLAAANSYTGNTRIAAGTLALGNPLALKGTTVDMNAADAGTLDLSGQSATLGGLKGTRNITIPDGQSLAVGANNGTSTYGGVLSGNGGLTKSGTGTLVLQGNSTYSGPTTIVAGTLRLQGALIPPQSPVAHYTFDGDLADATGHGHNGIMNGSGATFVTGKFGQALNFTGSPYVSVPYDVAFDASSFTVSAWVNLPGKPTGSIGYGILGTRIGGEYTYSTGVSDFVHGVVGDGNNFISTAVDIASTDTGTNGQGGNLKIGTWYMITYVIDNASPSKQFRMYIDGDLKKTISFTGTPRFMKPGESLLIGDDYGGLWHEPMNGKIDDVFFYNRALTAGEVKVLSTGGVVSSDPLPATTALSVASGATLDLNGTPQTIGSLSGAGSVTLGGATLTVGADKTNTSYSGAISGVGGLTKIGEGTLTLSGASTFSGPATVNAGTLNLDFSATGAPASNILNSSANSTGLVLGGGALQVTGNPAASSSQRFSGLTVSPGTSAISIVSNGTASLSVLLAALTRNTGGTLDIGGLAAGSTVSATSGANGAILSDNGVAYATVGGSDWAAKDSSTANIVSGSSLSGFYTLSTPAALSGNADVASGVDTVLAANAAISSLRFNVNEARTIDLGAHTLSVGGILVTAVAATPGSSITGGMLLGPAGRDLVVIQNSAQPLGISATIADSGGLATGLTKSGPGTLVLTGANTYTGTTTINTGVLSTSSPALGSAIVLGSGTATASLSYTGSTATLAAPVTVGAAGGLIEVTTPGQTLTLGTGGVTVAGPLTVDGSGNIAVTSAIAGAGGIVKVGSGTATLTGANTYSGGTVVNAGTLTVGSNGLGTAGPITFSGGTLQWVLGNARDLSSRIAPIASGQAAVLDTNGNYVTFAAGLSGDGGLTKAGAGTLVLQGKSAYRGPTTIVGGTLQLRGTPLPQNLVARYTFDGDYADASGNGHDGTITGPGASFVPGVFGQAVNFTRGQYVSVPYDPALDLSSFTVSAWVNLNGKPGSVPYGILGTRFGGDYTFDYAVLNDSLHGDVGNGTTWISSILNIAASDTGKNGQGGSLTPGAWHMVTYVVDNVGSPKQCRLYIDGDLKKSINLTGTPRFMMSGETLAIGNSYGREYMDGKIDDVLVYGRALTASEINGVYSGGMLGSDLLPTTTAVSLAAGTTLDLNGVAQTIVSLTGAGNVTLGAATLTLGDDNTDTTFGGSISGMGGLTKVGTGTLTLASTNSYSGLTSVAAGTLAINAPNAGWSDYATAAGANLSFGAKVGAGNIDGAGITTVQPSSTLTALRIRQSQLAIASDAKAVVAATATPNTSASTSRLGALAIAGSSWPAGTLDLNSNSLIIDYAGPLGTILSEVTAQIASGRNGKDAHDQANWNSKGIITTAGRIANVAAKADYYNLGAINNADLALGGVNRPRTTFGGQPVAPNTVLIKYTYSGDANLDGVVDGDDYNYWLNGFLGTTDTSVQGWLRGDFDYNGVVDADDYTQWLNSFLFAGPPLSGDGPSPVPEPSAFALLVVGCIAAGVWSWRRRRAWVGRF